MARKKAIGKTPRKATKDLPATGRKSRSVKGGVSFTPESGDEVVVAFQSGAVRAPVVLGNLWNGSDTPPTSGGGTGTTRPRPIKGS